MTDGIATLFDAWGTPSDEGRTAKTDAALDASIFFADSNTPALIIDRDDHLAYIAQFGQMMPGTMATIVKPLTPRGISGLRWLLAKAAP